MTDLVSKCEIQLGNRSQTHTKESFEQASKEMLAALRTFADKYGIDLVLGMATHNVVQGEYLSAGLVLAHPCFVAPIMLKIVDAVNRFMHVMATNESQKN